jgi:formate hydrogenlyase transcriptional activator
VNVRLIAATNRDLAMMVAKGEFRSDLYYRLKVFPILAPPLRDRVGDIPELVRHFVNLHSREMGKNIEEIPDNAMRALKRCRWPGNIRELSNFIERAVILTRGTVLEVAIDDLRGEQGEESHGSETLASSERELIVRVLRECRGQIGGIGGAAARLGLKRTTLNSKMKKLSIEKSDYMPSK